MPVPSTTIDRLPTLCWTPSLVLGPQSQQAHSPCSRDRPMLLSHSQMEMAAPFYSTGWSAWEMTSIAAQSLTAT